MVESKHQKNKEKNSTKGNLISWLVIIAIIIIGIVIAVAVFIFRTNDTAQELSQQDQEVTQTQTAESPTTTTESSVVTSQQPEIITETTTPGINGDNPLAGSSTDDVIAIAQDFASTFLESGFTSNEDMHREVDPFLTDSFREQFQTVEWYNVPNMQLEGRVEVFSQGTSDALVDVFLQRGGLMRVYLINQDGWKVDEYGIR